jgi:hypothetical protein
MALSDRAKEILKAAAQSEPGLIFISRDATYQTVVIDNKDFVKEQTPDQIAAAKAAVMELEQLGYLQVFIARHVFTLTVQGYEAAQQL